MTDYASEPGSREWKLIRRAYVLGEVARPSTEQSQEWLLSCAKAAEDMPYNDMVVTRGGQLEFDWELIDEEAESLVPYRTYDLWLIWADLELYDEWDEISEEWGFDSGSGQGRGLWKMPQLACWVVAKRILEKWHIEG